MHATAELNEALASIDGHKIEASLVDFASFGGTRIAPTPEQPERYATNRVALTPEDKNARDEFLAKDLADLGADVTIHVHPLGLIATLAGSNRDLAPVTIMSHTDTVPRGDMYDGVSGVRAGYDVMRAIIQHGVAHKRGIQLVAVTMEESSGFGVALGGSKAMFIGLSEAELNARLVGGPIAGDPSIGEALGEEGSRIAREPIFGEGRLFPTPHAVVELHVEQGNRLDTEGIDLGVVDVIAAPVRHEITFGSTALERDTQVHEHEAFFNLVIEGVANHSGACPMGYANRADGLVEAAQFISDTFAVDSMYTRSIAFGAVSIEEGALNKIPGRTTVQIRIGASTKEELDTMRKIMDVHIESQNQNLGLSAPRFKKNPLSLTPIEDGQQGVFFDQAEMRQRQLEAANTILLVKTFANEAASDSVVGTIGTFHTSDTGVITLGLDLRGAKEQPRDDVFEEIAEIVRTFYKTATMGPRRPGGSDPVEMDAGLVETASEVIQFLKIGTQQRMYSGAGHDVQNSARAGVPSVLLFVPSRDGIAHHPDAYTSPADLQRGVRALLGVVVELANS